MSSIYADYHNGRIGLTENLVRKGYGGNGGRCVTCHHDLKRFPVYDMGLCQKCYDRKLDNLKAEKERIMQQMDEPEK